MGGGAFAQAVAQGEPTLHTSRISTDDYIRIKNATISKLQAYFPTGKVVCLTEAPEKADYGDIDIFVALAQQVNFIDVANHLGATGVICHSSGKVQSCALGVRKDGMASTHSAVVYKHAHESSIRKGQPSTTVTTEEYAQIDVEIIPPELLEWHTFYSSYGDMVGLLGHIVTNLGFTVSDRGFWLRMKELDTSKKVQYVNVADKIGMLLLSSDPKKLMAFLGLSVASYDAGFKTLNELYEWLGACRLLSAEAIKMKRDNSHERNREQKRTVFSRFFNSWLPAHMDMKHEQDDNERMEIIHQLRQKYLEEAVDFFGKQMDYERMHDALVLAMDNAVAANLLKPLIAKYSGLQEKKLSEALRACRRWIGFRTNKPSILKTPRTDIESELHRFLGADKTSLKEPQATSEWVKENWDALRTLERQRGKAGGVENAWIGARGLATIASDVDQAHAMNMRR